MSKHYPVEQRDRAVKMVLDHLCECRSVYAACQAIGPKVGVGEESRRRWVLQAQVDASQRPRSHDCRAAADQGPGAGELRSQGGQRYLQRMHCAGSQRCCASALLARRRRK
jgi:transposase-like protein